MEERVSEDVDGTQERGRVQQMKLTKNFNWFKWMPESEIYETTRGNKYRYGYFQNDTTCLLFPKYNTEDRTVQWYAPTEQQIYYTKDNEIIEIYEIINKDNKEIIKNRTNVVKPTEIGAWK